MTQSPRQDNSDDRQNKVTWWQVLGSTIAAAFGVQKKANKERDFQHGRPLHFIIAGGVFTLVFVLVVYGVVQLVLRLAG